MISSISNRFVLAACLLAATFSSSAEAKAQAAPPVRVAVVGLVHGHVQGFLSKLAAHPEIALVGISDPDPALRQKYIAKTHLPGSMFFATEAEMLKRTQPQAILVYTSIAGHRAAIEEAAPLHIAAMVEKPLATTVEDALAIQALSERYNVPVLTNYETTWYNSNTAAVKMLEEGKIGELRKLVVHDGHEGPKEIGVDPEFFNWLTDPKQNGAGALFDFGCYGVDLATWILHGELPTTVTAVTLQIKPKIYPNVDDDSTVILTYPHAQAILQGSWNWPFARKDMEIYGATGYVDTVYDDAAPGAKLRVRLTGEKSEHVETAPALQPPQNDSLNYLAAVLGGTLKPQHDLNSLDTNITVVRILDAARRSAQSGKTIYLAREVAATK
jgi:predicted dehydrogenase